MTHLLPLPAERAYVPGMSPLMTAEELLQTNPPNKRTELVRGRLIVREPAGYNHGRVTMNLTVRLGAYVESAGCGDRKSTRLNSSHLVISYAVFCLKKKK